MNLNELFAQRHSKPTSVKYNALQLSRMQKKTENDDDAFNSTGNNLLDLFFMTEYFQRHLDEVKIGSSKKEQLFSMFIRDPRYGVGRRDLGRELMKQTGISADKVIKAGRFDDLLYNPTGKNLEYLKQAVLAGNELAKKWCPREKSKDKHAARALAKIWGMTDKEYRKAIKVDTTENKLSRHRETEIEFEKVPSLAMIKYYSVFMKKQEERFRAFTEAVNKGETKINIATQDVYNIYRNREKIDAQMFFDKMPKIKISCLPILDTSASMNVNDNVGKATAIAHYLSKCSTYCNGQLVAFSRNPHLITMGGTRKGKKGVGKITPGKIIPFDMDDGFKPDPEESQYINEIKSCYTGDVANTDFGKVMRLLKDLGDTPDYFVCLTDMEFDAGSSMDKDTTMEQFKKNGFKTKIIWWNFNERNKTVPEIDEYGNIFISGYNPTLLQYLEVGFDGEKFLNKLLDEYAKKMV